MQMVLHFILVKKEPSLTNLFLRKILCIYRNGSMKMLCYVLKPRNMLLHDFLFEYRQK